ncbi:LacI family DNA-binding transcriptional regulator [Streptomyces sp. TG1A-8]|uniref:LacI family DNA-binding transcriptional regulator n=1 Tax=Streptomyces sp. TG1A-8 TaxID=3051385 RepID=UPI00265BAF34|nr:LacI family DNA-binding transcriptional regulator [Streptomyces sp. TG1A-8]MDO0929515.1 LacI family DNA-binding transcriptional regulator [Streptomyces sp. TG1A-8]
MSAYRSPSRAATANDVARMAQVSQSTVSLVLNGKWEGRIREETARRVTLAAETLGYRVNQAARSLRLGATGTVLLVTPTLGNSAFADVYTGIATVGTASGMGVVVFPLAAEDGYGPFPAPKQAIDGVIACSMPADAVADLSRGLPLVVLDDASVPRAPTVCMDVGQGMADALAHLVSLGHRRIAHLRAERPAWTFAQRARAFDQCVLGHPGVEGTRVVSPLLLGEVKDRMTAVLSSPGRPTAVICDDDTMAMGVYVAARTAGLAVGRDLSVVGFDDLPFAPLVVPSLTTVRLPLGDLGRRGMEMFIELRNGNSVAPVELPARLVVRDSTGPVPADPYGP